MRSRYIRSIRRKRYRRRRPARKYIRRYRARRYRTHRRRRYNRRRGQMGKSITVWLRFGQVRSNATRIPISGNVTNGFVDFQWDATDAAGIPAAIATAYEQHWNKYKVQKLMVRFTYPGNPSHYDGQDGFNPTGGDDKKVMYRHVEKPYLWWKIDKSGQPTEVTTFDGLVEDKGVHLIAMEPRGWSKCVTFTPAVALKAYNSNLTEDYSGYIMRKPQYHELGAGYHSRFYGLSWGMGNATAENYNYTAVFWETWAKITFKYPKHTYIPTRRNPHINGFYNTVEPSMLVEAAASTSEAPAPA